MNIYIRGSKLNGKTLERLLYCFASDIPATKAAKISMVSVNTSQKVYEYIRRKLHEHHLDIQSFMERLGVSVNAIRIHTIREKVIESISTKKEFSGHSLVFMPRESFDNFHLHTKNYVNQINPDDKGWDAPYMEIFFQILMERSFKYHEYRMKFIKRGKRSTLGEIPPPENADRYVLRDPHVFESFYRHVTLLNIYVKTIRALGGELPKDKFTRKHETIRHELSNEASVTIQKLHIDSIEMLNAYKQEATDIIYQELKEMLTLYSAR
jgi:hypothetical protein